MAARIGPKALRGRALNRGMLGYGKVRKRTGKGTYVDLDVSPLWEPVADGVLAAGVAILEDATAHAPDDPATPGSRIQDSGIVGVYAFGNLIDSAGPGKWRKPRSFRPQKEGVDAVVSFKSPLHHLHELGTVHMPARPYLGPARMAIADAVPGILAQHFPKEGPG